MHKLTEEEQKLKKAMQEARAALKKGKRLVDAAEYTSLSYWDQWYFDNYQCGQLKKKTTTSQKSGAGDRWRGLITVWLKGSLTQAKWAAIGSVL